MKLCSSSYVRSLNEALNMEIIINQALIDILVAKDIFTQEELMAKIEEIRKEMPKVTSQRVSRMPIYKLICKSCGKVFDKILPSSDMSSVICSVCNSSDIKRVFSVASSTSKGGTTIPAGALSSGTCQSCFS